MTRNYTGAYNLAQSLYRWEVEGEAWCNGVASYKAIKAMADEYGVSIRVWDLHGVPLGTYTGGDDERLPALM